MKEHFGGKNAIKTHLEWVICNILRDLMTKIVGRYTISLATWHDKLHHVYPNIWDLEEFHIF